jgi:hypothetical protein
MLSVRRRAGLLVGATTVIVCALSAPALAISAALHHPANKGAPSSAGSSTDLIWAGGVILAVAVVVGLFVFKERIRDRARSIVGADGTSTREFQSRPTGQPDRV